jgi:hypothetical protein
MPNVVKIVKGVAKAVGKKKSAAANKKGLKAANKGSMAPKGYKTDAERRKALMTIRSTEKSFGKGSANKFKDSSEALATIAKPAPKNAISKSGRVANTSGLKYKAAKKGK